MSEAQKLETSHRVASADDVTAALLGHDRARRAVGLVPRDGKKLAIVLTSLVGGVLTIQTAQE